MCDVCVAEEALAAGRCRTDQCVAYRKGAEITWHDSPPAIAKPKWRTPKMGRLEKLRLKWASQPPGWLSNFQREKAGLPVAPLTEQFWTTVNQVEAAVRGYIQEQHWIPTQKQAIDMMAGFEQWKVGFATQHGLDEEVAREQLAPFDRAYVAKQLPEPYWQPVVQTLNLVKQALGQVSTNRDGTPASIDSIAGRPVFDAFAAWLDRLRASRSDLDDALTRWGKILGDADQPLVGVDLYRVLLFGEFR